MSYIDQLITVAGADVDGLKAKDKEYGGSWKKRGGIGAFMMLARKWDRLEERVKNLNYDVFTAVQGDDRSETVIDDIRDLRRYLLLVEAECRAQGMAAALTLPGDEQFPHGSVKPPLVYREFPSVQGAGTVVTGTSTSAPPQFGDQHA